MNRGLILGVAVIFFTLVGAGGYFFFVHQPNQPDVRYIHVKGVRNLSEPQRDRMQQMWEMLIKNDELLSKLIDHADIKSKWNMTEEEALKSLRERQHLKINKGKGLQVGFSGKRSEQAELNKLAQGFFSYGAQIITKNYPELGEALR